MEAGYYISSGTLGKMFTLRHWYKDGGVNEWTGEPNHYDHHVRTLSNDLEKAKAKAAEVLGDTLFEVRITEVGTITRRNLGPKDHTLLPGCLPPNYSGVTFKDEKFRPGQLFWAWEEIKEKISYKKTADLLFEYMKEKGIAVWHEGAWTSSAFVEMKLKREKEAKERAENSNFVGEIKERLKGVELTLDVMFFFENEWGTTYINIMSDDAGNVFTYKGKYVGEKGDTFTMTATVKEHTTYKGVKQTVVNRPIFNFTNTEA